LPDGPAFRWAATLNEEVGKTTYPTNSGSVGMEGREGGERQSHKEEDRRRRESGALRQAVGREGYTWIFVQRPEFLVTPLLMGPVCLLCQGRFEESVHPY